MTTAEAARAADCSVQQVRRLETLGAIPAAERQPNGYRVFTDDHVRALVAYRRLASAIGPVAALDTFISRPKRSPADTAAVLGGFAAGLDAERTRAVAVREMLVGLDAETDDGAESMTISQLTHALGVPASTLRFWEDEGLVSPDRVALGGTSARVYRTAAIREARITAELRAAGYRIPAVRVFLDALRAHGEVGETRAALDSRIEALSRRLLDFFRAAAAIIESP
ncbi:MerR family transcriptional regulator [Brevibacterium casei]|uniref:MerR family transcriptional regulator n=1 Tax=Brevibacterium casei TaxID=33889 RepID=UPI0021AFC50A|nr:MerR family transcriptional regulator [Brevibacterium casei]MCT2357667.1 MerR family transcriptional regulator [Brevibacterium casei]